MFPLTPGLRAGVPRSVAIKMVGVRAKWRAGTGLNRRHLKSGFTPSWR